MGDATLLRVLLPQAVTLERHSAGQVEIPLRLRMTDPMAGLSLERMLVEQTELFAVSGDLVVCAGWGRKKIKLERVPLNQILATFGANPEELKKLWE